MPRSRKSRSPRRKSKSPSRRKSPRKSKSPSRRRKSSSRRRKSKSPRKSARKQPKKLSKEVKSVQSPFNQERRPNLFAKFTTVIPPEEIKSAVDSNAAGNIVDKMARDLNVELTADAKLILIVFIRDLVYLVSKLIEKREIDEIMDVARLLKSTVTGGVRTALVKNFENHQLVKLKSMCSINEGPAECAENRQIDLTEIFIKMLVREIIATAQNLKEDRGPLSELDINRVRKDRDLNFTLKLFRL